MSPGVNEGGQPLVEVTPAHPRDVRMLVSDGCADGEELGVLPLEAPGLNAGEPVDSMPVLR